MIIFKDLLNGARLALWTAESALSIRISCFQRCCMVSTFDGRSVEYGFAGDELLSDSYNPQEVEDGFFYEVEGKVRYSPFRSCVCPCFRSSKRLALKNILVNWRSFEFVEHQWVLELCCAVQWEVLADVEVNTGANPSAEGGDEDGGGGDARRVVDLIEFFKLNVRTP